MKGKMFIAMLVAVALLTVSVLYVTTGTSHTSSSHVYPQEDHSLGAITGRVLDANGQPVAGAEVHALKSDVTMGKIPTAYTDQQGNFQFNKLPPGAYGLSAGKEKDGYPQTDNFFYSVVVIETPQVVVYENQITSGVALHFGPRVARLVGRVVDSATNKPIKNLQDIQIKLYREDNPDYSYTTSPDLEGEFTVLVPSVPFTIEVSAPAYEKWNNRGNVMQLTPSIVKELNIPLRPLK
ncbi:MAG: carboxypeptidase regulatory-like domain-containing protein [Pyrinomonadaceae bacterium]